MIKLSNIAITHISLVKSGANGKSIIYKSSKVEPTYQNQIQIKKTDGEKGMIYGIVYSPNEEDSQGEFATAEEIEKASYGFMKARNVGNVDIEHSFNNTDAYVVENWILKAGDPTFPNEPVGSWCVGIKLESEELKEMAKSGDIAGISMAGMAERTEVEKAENDNVFKKLWDALGEAVTGFSLDVWTHVEKGEKVDIVKYQKEAKEQIKTATADIQKAFVEIAERSNDAKESVNKATKEIETLVSLNEKRDVLTKSLSQEVETLKQTIREMQDTLKKSKQVKQIKREFKDSKDSEGVI